MQTFAQLIIVMYSMNCMSVLYLNEYKNNKLDVEKMNIGFLLIIRFYVILNVYLRSD